MRPLVIATAAAVTLGLAAAAIWFALTPDPDSRLAACRAGGGGAGVADIGGAFTLTAHDGRTMTEADVITGPTLMYFGYSFCPDFCPMDLAIMAEAADVLAERGQSVQLAFISVDPARDTPEALAPFVENIHPDLIGLTGTEAQVNAAARAWRVYHAMAGDPDDPFYLVDHSTFTYLMAPEVGFLDFFNSGTDPAAMADSIACYIDALS